MATLIPLFSRSMAIDAEVSPLPKEETTPPLMKIYFVFIGITGFAFESNNFKLVVQKEQSLKSKNRLYPKIFLESLKIRL
ncbi:MAG: hypothetical protein EBZ47_06105 [Chlamydiae bacterium]|nr:hypothetical protein [Chlamydiota bacterium]